MEFEEHHEEVVNICPEQNVTEEMDKPFLDVAQFFLDDDENDKVEELGEEEEEEEQDGSRKPYKTFTAVQLQEAQLLDSSKTFVPISQELDDSFVSHIDTEIIPLPDIVGANPLMFLNEEEELYPNVGRDFLSVIPEGFQGDDLLLAGEGDLFMDETNFFNFSRELEERERDTPSPANDDTEKEDEGEGEEHIKMEDKARTISPLQLHAPSTTTKLDFPNKDEMALLNKTAASALDATSEVPASPTKSRKRSLACISGSKADQKRTKRKRKTPEQLAVLEREFDANPMPNKEVRDQLSSRLGLTSRQVQIWFQNKRAKVKNNSNSSSGSNGSTPFQSPSTSRSSSPLLMLAPQQQAQQKGQPRLVPANFAPENFAAMAAAAAHPHPIPLAPNAFFDILSGRSVNQFLASLAALTPHQQQALCDLPAILANNAHIVPTPIAPAPTHTPIAPAPTPAHAPIPILPASPDIQKASVNKPVSTAV